MRKEEAIKFYGSQSALALALGIAQASVAGWREYPPDKRQLQLERLTDQKLKAEPECEARVLGLDLKRKTDRKPAKPRKQARVG